MTTKCYTESGSHHIGSKPYYVRVGFKGYQSRWPAKTMTTKCYTEGVSHHLGSKPIMLEPRPYYIRVGPSPGQSHHLGPRPYYVRVRLDGYQSDKTMRTKCYTEGGSHHLGLKPIMFELNPLLVRSQGLIIFESDLPPGRSHHLGPMPYYVRVGPGALSYLPWYPPSPTQT